PPAPPVGPASPRSCSPRSWPQILDSHGSVAAAATEHGPAPGCVGLGAPTGFNQVRARARTGRTGDQRTLPEADACGRADVGPGAGAASSRLVGRMAEGVAHPAETGGSWFSGRIRGETAAAPAIIGAVRVWSRVAGGGSPGSSGAEMPVGAAGGSTSRPWPIIGAGPRRRWDSGAVAAPVPWVRAGVTLLPLPEPRTSASGTMLDVTPPRATAARDTAPAATNANRSPREAGRSVSWRLTSWMRKPRLPGSAGPCGRAGA